MSDIDTEVNGTDVENTKSQESLDHEKISKEVLDDKNITQETEPIKSKPVKKKPAPKTEGTAAKKPPAKKTTTKKKAESEVETDTSAKKAVKKTTAKKETSKTASAAPKKKPAAKKPVKADKVDELTEKKPAPKKRTKKTPSVTEDVVVEATIPVVIEEANDAFIIEKPVATPVVEEAKMIVKETIVVTPTPVKAELEEPVVDTPAPTEVKHKEVKPPVKDKVKENTFKRVEVDTPIYLENIKKVKVFFVSDMDEEAAYLHEMSLQGYHFVTKESIYHIFKQGEPKNYYYHLGYHEKDKRNGDHYLGNYTDAGWENIFHEKAEFDGIWNYFRIEMPQGEAEPNIFSDRVSRMALYERMLSSWRSLLAMVFICFLAMIYVCYFLSGHPSNLTWIFMIISIIVFIVIVLTLLIYSRAYFKISRKLEELKHL